MSARFGIVICGNLLQHGGREDDFCSNSPAGQAIERWARGMRGTIPNKAMALRAALICAQAVYCDIDLLDRAHYQACIQVAEDWLRRPDLRKAAEACAAAAKGWYSDWVRGFPAAGWCAAGAQHAYMSCPNTDFMALLKQDTDWLAELL